MDSLSFDPMVQLYDETRTFDQASFDAALDFIVQRFPPRDFPRAFEPGIGTGRIAIPLGRRGYRVAGSDISEQMLAVLKRKLSQSAAPLPISVLMADVTALPYRDAAFDLAIAVHLFYFVQNWKTAADEMLRVVRPEGPLVLMHTGCGTEIPFVIERYKEICAERGFPVRHIGASGTNEVVDYLVGRGCRTERIRDRWKWVSRIRLDRGLDYMKSRAYSYTTVAPDDIHLDAIEIVESELRREFGNLETEVEVPNQVCLVIISRQ